MKVSALCGSGYGDVRVEAEKLTDLLYADLFAYATSTNQTSTIDNTLLINLGLLKVSQQFIASELIGTTFFFHHLI